MFFIRIYDYVCIHGLTLTEIFIFSRFPIQYNGMSEGVLITAHLSNFREVYRPVLLRGAIHPTVNWSYWRRETAGKVEEWSKGFRMRFWHVKNRGHYTP